MPPVLDPQTQQAKAISDLFVVTLSIGGGIILLVTVLTIYFAIRFRSRARDGEAEPKQIHGNRKWEISWTIAPALLLAGLLVPTIIVMNVADPGVSFTGLRSAGTAEPDLEIIGHQFWWEYRFPKAGVVTANELNFPVENQLLVQIEGADVIHDWWVPQLGRKMDAIPGKPNQFMLKADNLGLYFGACSEYCGAEHAWMLIRVLVQPQASFDSWLAAQKQIPAPPTDPAARRGLQVFFNNPCATCHTIAGTAANGQNGPNLTHLGSRRTLGTGILVNTPANLRRWIKDAPAVKPGVQMPSYHQLSDQDINDLAAYLESLK